MKKYFILNADDFGMSKTRNQAIVAACRDGFLKSASLCVNGEAFDDAVNRVHECPGLGLGVHLNIIEGKALVPGSSLTDSSGLFRPGFIRLLLQSGGKHFLQDVENEFRAQIETGQKHVRFDHIDSHVHTHGIPAIFNIAAKLARDYKIPAVRTQYERRYMVPHNRSNTSAVFAVNRIKIALLNTFTAHNRKTLDTSLKTNDYLIGVGYTAMMNAQTVAHGLKAVTKQAAKHGIERLVVEALFHPDSLRQNAEYQIPFDRRLAEQITAMGFELVNYGAV
ncbi:MAG: ChbG/HpnK family deacetylase [Treponema sp.]|nr:ChbG/HpnK family deacetylase [Treponema sp.]